MFIRGHFFDLRGDDTFASEFNLAFHAGLLWLPIKKGLFRDDHVPKEPFTFMFFIIKMLQFVF
jgi:hypothetical protein